MTEPQQAPPAAPALSPLGWARWAWRVLTSMRTALILLVLLALGALPGSLLPQRGVSVEEVQNYFLEHPDLAPVLDRFFLFDVYSSPWYAAIYLLLVVSLVGCVLPRAGAHYRLLRARPPKTPRRLDRMPYSATFETDATPEQVFAEARGRCAGIGSPTTATRYPRRPATCARPATWSSTCHWWACSCRWRAPRSSATGATSSSSKRTRSPTADLLRRLLPGNRGGLGQDPAVLDPARRIRSLLRGGGRDGRPSRELPRRPHLPGAPGRPRRVPHPGGQPPAPRRRRPGLPARPRLRPYVPGHRRRRARGLRPGGAVPGPRRRQLHLRRGGESPRHRPGAAGLHRGVPSLSGHRRQRRPRLGVPGRAQPHGGAQGLCRRPRIGQRQPPVGVPVVHQAHGGDRRLCSVGCRRPLGAARWRHDRVHRVPRLRHSAGRQRPCPTVCAGQRGGGGTGAAVHPVRPAATGMGPCPPRSRRAYRGRDRRACQDRGPRRCAGSTNWPPS